VTTPTPPVARPPDRSGGGASRASAPSDGPPFAAFLTDDRARTAAAEGPKNEAEPATNGPAPDEHPAAHAGGAAPAVETAADPAQAPEAQAPAAPVVTAPAPVPVPVPVEATAARAPVVLPTPPVTNEALAGGQPAATPALTGPAESAPAVTAPTATEAKAAAPAKATVPGPPADAAAPGVEERSPVAAERAQGAAPAPARGETATPAAGLSAAPREGAAQQQQPGQSAAPAPAPAQAAPAAPPAAAPVGPPALPGHAPSLERAVPLDRAVRTTEAALAVAAQRGVTTARLNLRPAELGGIEIHLRHGAQGLTARIVADAPEAVAALQQAGPELRRSLEEQGVTLLGLDIGARGDEQRRAHADRAAEAEAAARGRNGRSGATGDDGDDLAGAVPAPAVRLALPGGALIDVIA